MSNTDEVFVSALNFHEAVLRESECPKRVTVCDVTLREGQQTAGVEFNLEQKVSLARRIDAIGVGEIEIGWPHQSELDRRVLQILKQEGLNAATEVLAPVHGEDWRSVLDAALNSGADVVTLMDAVSDIRLRESDAPTTREQMLQRAVEATRYAATGSAVVTFALVDATRSDLAFATEVASSVVEAGADRIAVADTTGAITPAAMKFLCSQVRAATAVPVRVHCHNDFGLAVANTLAAVEGGASIVDVAVNGLGERSGNASLDEVVVALEILYRTKTGVNLEALYDLAHYVSQESGIPLPFNKPLVGDNAFAHKFDQHVMRVMQHPPLYETIDPGMVGNRRAFPLGSQSGEFTVKAKLQELGLRATDAQLRELTSRVVDAASKKGSVFTDADFGDLAQEFLNSKCAP